MAATTKPGSSNRPASRGGSSSNESGSASTARAATRGRQASGSTRKAASGNAANGSSAGTGKPASATTRKAVPPGKRETTVARSRKTGAAAASSKSGAAGSRKQASTARQRPASRSRARASKGQGQGQGDRDSSTRNEARSREDHGARDTIASIGIPVVTATIGVAGGVVLGRTALQNTRKILGMRLPGKSGQRIALASVAKQIGEAGRQFGKLAGEVRTAREKAEKISRAIS
jgi:hypothetical protein